MSSRRLFARKKHLSPIFEREDEQEIVPYLEYLKQHRARCQAADREISIELDRQREKVLFFETASNIDNKIMVFSMYCKHLETATWDHEFFRFCRNSPILLAEFSINQKIIEIFCSSTVQDIQTIESIVRRTENEEIRSFGFRLVQAALNAVRKAEKCCSRFQNVMNENLGSPDS